MTRQATLRAPDLVLLVGTRVALGIGIGLLVASRLDPRARTAAGVALLAVGVATTIPILLNVRSDAQHGTGSHRAAPPRGSTGPGTDRRGARSLRDVPTPP